MALSGGREVAMLLQPESPRFPQPVGGDQPKDFLPVVVLLRRVTGGDICRAGALEPGERRRCDAEFGKAVVQVRRAERVFGHSAFQEVMADVVGRLAWQ